LKNGLCQPFEYRVITKTGHANGCWKQSFRYIIRAAGRSSQFHGYYRNETPRRETKLTNERLTALVKNLEQQHRQNAILTEMRDMLQACSKMDEIAPIIMGFMKKLFPFVSGRVVPVKQFPHRPRIRGHLGRFPLPPPSITFSRRTPAGDCAAAVPMSWKMSASAPTARTWCTRCPPLVCLPLMAKAISSACSTLKISPGH